MLFNTWLGFYYLLVGSFGFTISTLVNFTLSILWVFDSGVRFSRGKEIASVYIVSLIGLVLHVVKLAMLIEEMILF